MMLLSNMKLLVLHIILIEQIFLLFQYENQKNVLEQFNLKIEQGEILAFVGKSGAGKSTVANLLVGLYDIQDGKITIDGHNISEYSLESLRNQLCVVNQNFTIIEGTIKENLKFGNPNVTDEELWKVLKKVNMYDLVQKMPNQLDTKLESGGQQLSHGQEQRIAIARIFLKNPKILIMDESTTSIDIETEQKLQKEWKELFAGKTVIIIAHRIDSILMADKIAMIENGHIIGYGNHDELSSNCRAYKDLFTECNEN